MSVNVDPFVIPIPQKWLTDPDLAPTVQYLWRFLYDMWLRSGGGNDALSNLEDSALYDVGIKGAEIAEITKQIEELRIQSEIIISSVSAMHDSLSKQIAAIEAMDNTLLLMAEITEIRKRLEALENGNDT